MNDKNNYTVYMHISPSNKVYIGITCREGKNRWENGKCYLRKNTNGSYTQPAIAKAILKYGWENFEHIILFENLTKEEAERRERLLIALWNSNNSEFGYNIRSGGSASTFSEEARKRMSESRMGENSSMYGRRHSEETKRKMSEAAMGEKNHMYGKHPSEETRKKMSESLRGEKNPNYGKHYSEERKKQMSEARKGKYTGENSPNWGRCPSEDTRRKMREAKIGKPTGRGKTVYCIDLDRQWNTIAEAEKETGASHITCVLKGERKSSGRHPITGEKLHWIEIEKQNLMGVIFNETIAVSAL